MNTIVFTRYSFKSFSEKKMKRNRWMTLMSKDKSSKIHIGEFKAVTTNYEKVIDKKIDSKLYCWFSCSRSM